MNDGDDVYLKDRDYYINEQGLFVFTENFLIKRGFCCANGCVHCPYPKEEKPT